MGHVHDASLSLNSFSFPRKCAQLNEREKELGVGKERENFVFVVLFCFVLCGMPREGGKRGKTTLVFLGNEEKETNFGDAEFF